MRVCVVVGTRPEIIKMASVIEELQARRCDFTVIHTGQHYDHEMSKVFFEELELPAPEANLATRSGTQAEQTAKALTGLERIFVRLGPDIVLVEGDTNTVLAGALAAVKLGIRVGHVEAGLRSYDLRMPEEHNRRLADHVSSYLFAPTKRSADTLRREDCWGRILVVGNTVIDACLKYGPKAERESLMPSKVRFERFALATIHRAENVDSATVLREFCRIFVDCPVPVVCPIHPRTRARFRSAGLLQLMESSKNVQLMSPVGYMDFLWLMMHCEFIMTDSGGIQEEATAPNIRKRVFVLRKSTERPEAIEAGYAVLVGTAARQVLPRVRAHLRAPSPHVKGPFGDGTAGKRIIRFLLSEFSSETRQLLVRTRLRIPKVHPTV